PKRRARDDHRYQAHPFAAHRVARVLEADTQGAHQVGEREEGESERQRNDVARERDGDERGTEPRKAEDERPGERDRAVPGTLARAPQAPRTRLGPSERFIERRRRKYLVNGRPRRDSSRPARRRSSSHSSLGGTPLRAKAAMFWSY